MNKNWEIIKAFQFMKANTVTKFRVFSVFLVIGLVLLMSVSGFAAPLVQETQEKEKEKIEVSHYPVAQATSEIKVDGVLDEKAWEDAGIIKLPYEWLPGDNIPSPVDTDCMVTFDKKFFYVGFRCYDPDPSKIRAHLMDRDSITGGGRVKAGGNA